MRNKCVTGGTSVPSIECKLKKRRQLYWRAGQGLGSICRQAGWSSGAFTQRHLPRKGEELNSDHLVQNPACFPLRLPGPKLPMTPLHGAKYGLPSQGILAAAVRSSLWWRCTLAQQKHLDALHGSVERKFSHSVGTSGQQFLKSAVQSTAGPDFPWTRACVWSAARRPDGVWTAGYVVVEMIRI